jgi:hypothetical protein
MGYTKRIAFSTMIAICHKRVSLLDTVANGTAKIFGVPARNCFASRELKSEPRHEPGENCSVIAAIVTHYAARRGSSPASKRQKPFVFRGRKRF